MDKQKINTLVFFVLWLIAAILLIGNGLKMLSVIHQNQTEVPLPDFLQMQKKLTLINISFFVPLLISALLGYYFNHRKNLLFLCNLLYIAIILFVYVNINKEYHQLNEQIAIDQKGYWLFLFIGVFYVLGAVLVTTIGFITVRNLLNRDEITEKKGTVKMNRRK